MRCSVRRWNPCDGGVDVGAGTGTGFCELGKAVAMIKPRGVRALLRVLVGGIRAVDFVGDLSFCESDNGTEKGEWIEAILRDMFAPNPIPMHTVQAQSWASTLAWSRGGEDGRAGQEGDQQRTKMHCVCRDVVLSCRLSWMTL